MTFLISRHDAYRVLDPAHVMLVVRPDVPHLDRVPPSWVEHGHTAVSVAGILARVALDVDYTMRVQLREHSCPHDIRRYRPDTDELVEGQQYEGCRIDLAGATEDDPYHLIRHGSLPSLHLHVPPNREQTWRTRIAAALERIATENHVTTTRPPVIDDD